MNFQLIEPCDLPAIFDIRAATRENTFSREALRDLGITEESTAELLRSTHRGWLAEEDGKITGFAIGDGKTGELWVIAMLPEYEGRGIGSQLLRLVEDWLWSLGWMELWLWTSSDEKKRAFSFYTKHGWTVSKIEGEIVYMKKQRHWTIRLLATDDRDRAIEIFYHGLYNQGEPLPGREILDLPIMRPYLDGFPSADDTGFVCCAKAEQEIAGVVYCRFFRADHCGVGFYRADVPELSIGVMPAYRNMGCGTALMSALLEETDRRGLDVSLNCGLKNRARHLYERFGFSILDSRPVGYLMLRKAKAKNALTVTMQLKSESPSGSCWGCISSNKKTARPRLTKR